MKPPNPESPGGSVIGRVIPAREPGPAAAPTPPAGVYELYRQEARRYPRLSAEEEHELAERVHRNGDREAAKRLVLHHLWLVLAIAWEYRRMASDIVDLLQEGSLGLLEAVHRFDPFRETRLSTYARYWIRAYMLRYLLANHRIVDLGKTRAGRKLFYRLQRERAAIEARGLDVTPRLLEDRLGVERAEIARVEPILRADFSLDRPRRDDDSGALSQSIANPAAENPATVAAQTDFQRTLREHLDAFEATLTDEREIAVWREHLAAESPLSLSTLGERFSVSKQRMGQIADRLKRRCREHLVKQLGPETQIGWVFEET